MPTFFLNSDSICYCFHIVVDIRPRRLSHSNLVRRDTGHDNQRIMRQHPRRTVVPALATLLTTVCVTHSIYNPVDAPDGSQYSGSYGPSEARDQECADHGGMVFAKVLVRTLRRVESQHRLLGAGRRGLDLLVRSVLEGVWDLGRLAERSDAATVPGTDEEGADDGAEDVAGNCQVYFQGYCGAPMQKIGNLLLSTVGCNREGELTRTRRG